MKHVLSKFLITIGALIVNSIVCYTHNPCTRAVRAQFQLPDCYLPDMDTSIDLSSASFLMSHDAATGYIQPGSLSKTGLSWWYSKNQVGGVYQQLNDGARALDLRPKMLTNGTVIFHHGAINIPVTFEQVIEEAVRWCADHPDELVLLLPAHFGYETSTDDDNSNMDIVSAMSTIYQKLGVGYYHCSDVYGLTVGEAMQLAALPTGGYLLALDGQDYYGTFCGKANYIEGEIVTCYPNTNTSCKTSPEPLKALQQYILASANNEASDDKDSLGPPADLYYHPFNEIQALWQVSASSAAIGLAHLSSILEDNKKSGLNEDLVNMIYEGEFNAISLFAVDNVVLNGNALLSVLRNTCGQSQTDICGRELDRPKLTHFHLSRGQWVGLAVALYIGWMVYSAIRWKRPKLLFTLISRLLEKANGDKAVLEDDSSSRREELLQTNKQSEAQF